MTTETKYPAEKPLSFYQRVTKRFGANLEEKLTAAIETVKNHYPSKLELIEVGVFAWIKVIFFDSHVPNACFLFDGENFINIYPVDNLEKTFSLLLKEAKPTKSDLDSLLEVFPKLFFYFSSPKVIRTQEDLDEATKAHHGGLTLPYFRSNSYYFSVISPRALPYSAFNVSIDLQTFDVEVKKSQEKALNLQELKILFEQVLKENKPNNTNWLASVKEFPSYYIHPSALEIILDDEKRKEFVWDGYKRTITPSFDEKELCFSVIVTNLSPTIIWNVKICLESYKVEVEVLKKEKWQEEDLKFELKKIFNPNAVEKFFHNRQIEFDKILPMEISSFKCLIFENFSSRRVSTGAGKKVFLYWNGDFIEESTINLFCRVLKTKELDKENLEDILDFYSTLFARVLKNKDEFESYTQGFFRGKWMAPKREGDVISFLISSTKQKIGLSTVEISIKEQTHKTEIICLG